MTVLHYLISPIGLCVWSAWAKLYKVIARDITIYGTFAFFTQQQFEANKHCEIKFGWITVFSDYKYKQVQLRWRWQLYWPYWNHITKESHFNWVLITFWDNWRRDAMATDTEGIRMDTCFLSMLCEIYPGSKT